MRSGYLSLYADLLERMVQTPVILVVEDSYLADSASEGVLAAVARRAQQQPWLLLVTRDDRPTGWMPTATGRIELGPLDMTSSIELAEMATPERPLPPAIAEELAVRSGGHPLLLRELARAAARGEDPDELPSTVEELAASQIDQLPLAERSLLRRAAVLGDEFPEDLLLQMLRDVAPERSGPNCSPGCRASLSRPVTCSAFATRFFGKLRTPACPTNDAANCTRRPPRFWKPPPPRRIGAPSSSHFTTSWPATTTRRWTTAGGPGSGQWHVMRRPRPPTPIEGRPRLLDFPRASARASVRSIWKRWAMQSSWRAGRPRLPRPIWKRCGVRGQPLREAHLALKLTRVEQRRGHYSNALRRASLGLRALSGVTGPEAGAVRARLQARYAFCRSIRVATRMPADGRSGPRRSRGG